MVSTNDVSVIVPVFNEASVLDGVIRGLRLSFDDVICIDDGSSDGSGEVARLAGASVVRHALNLGQGAALQTGFEFVLRQRRSRYVVTFDGDGQHDPQDALTMVELAREHALDVVLGSRITGAVTDQPRTRRWLLRLGVQFTRWTTGLPVTDTHNGLRVLSRETLAAVRLNLRGMAYASELESAIASLGLAWREAPVNVTYTPYSRAKGQGNINAVNVLYDLVVARMRPRT